MVIIAVPGTVEAAVIPGIPIPGVPIRPGSVVPRAVVTVQVPGTIGPGIVPAVVVHHGDIRSQFVETELGGTALRDDDGVAGAEHVYFGFLGLADQGIHFLLGNGSLGGCRPGRRIDAVLELLRRGRKLCHRAAGRSGNKGNQVESQMLFHVRTSFYPIKISIFVPDSRPGLRGTLQYPYPFSQDTGQCYGQKLKKTIELWQKR